MPARALTVAKPGHPWPRAAVTVVTALALGLGFLAMTTYASWADAEWAELADTSLGTPETNRFNLRVSAAAAGVGDAVPADWSDTGANAAPDGAFESAVTSSPALPSSAALFPGWTGTSVVNLWNDSTDAAALALQVPPSSVAAPDVAGRFTVSVTVYRVTAEDGQITALTPAELQDGPVSDTLLATLYPAADGGTGPWALVDLAAGEWVQVAVSVTWCGPTLGGATCVADADLPGLMGQVAAFDFEFRASQVPAA
jgi:hypothetical protein